ncbi:Transcription factor [Macleaya cordata]|uniref:Transcription factor n=1 Tax=Macleaya cordata TaxID=56857 RepID=A0A200QTU3_MACCD|nr:Transcription factor [Macleaya cordata]
MGRRELEMKKIENLQARNVCFSKRRKGIIKQAEKLSKLCNLDIHFITFSPAGEPYVSSTSCGNSSSSSASFDSVIQNYLNDAISDSDLHKTEFQPQIPDVKNDHDLLSLNEVKQSWMDVDVTKLSLSQIQSYKRYLEKLKSEVAHALEKKTVFEDNNGEGEGSFMVKDELPLPMISTDDSISSDQSVYKGAIDEIDDQMHLFSENEHQMINANTTTDQAYKGDGDKIDHDKMLFRSNDKHFDDIDEVVASFE